MYQNRTFRLRRTSRETLPNNAAPASDSSCFESDIDSGKYVIAIAKIDF